MSKVACGSCGRPNEAGARFCSECGRSTETQAYCPGCNTLQPVSSRYCIQCGADMKGASFDTPPGDGAVIEGVWERGPGEFIRRVDPEDCRTFLGSRSVRVPPGTIGVILVDGVVREVLPPGERTAIGRFERIANFFTGRGDRTAFYLVDLRPIPVPFTVTTRPSSQGRTVQTQVVVSFSLQKGNKEGIAAFIANVLGSKAGFSGQDLYSLLRPEVTRIATLALERLANDGELSYADAEALVRRDLETQLGTRTGLAVSVALAPLTSTASLSFHLGTGAAPRVRACSTCAAELPATLKFCDRCGERQPTLLSPDRACGKCGIQVPEADGFCSGCGQPYTPAPATAAPLFSADDVQVEVDLVVRVQGQHEDFEPERIAPALVGAAAAHLRGQDFARFASGEGFSAMELAIRSKVEAALAAFGLQLVSVSVVDVRSKTGQWLLGARSDLNRARQEVLLGREWLSHRTDEIDLAEQTFAQKLEQQRVQRNDAFARDKATLEDRRRREELAGGQASLDVAEAQRAADRDIKIGAARQAAGNAERSLRQEVELADLRHDMRKETETFGHEAGLTRGAMDLESEKARSTVNDAVYATRSQKELELELDARRAKLEREIKDTEEARQMAKLRGMADLERQLAQQEHEQRRAMVETMKGMSERQMIAAQASDLAASEGGGAAWAQALAGDEARRLGAEHAQKLEQVMAQQLDRMEQLTAAALESTRQREGGTAQIYQQSMDAMSRVAASRAAPRPAPAISVKASGGAAPEPATGPCKNPGCSARLAAEAKFCGSCGHEQ
jgi:hypothetical protein